MNITTEETKLLMEDKLSVGGKSLREIYEVVNHNKVFDYIAAKIAANEPLSESIIKDFHQILMENIISGGFYRDTQVYISGSQHTPPTPHEAYHLVKDFYKKLENMDTFHPLEKAAFAHAEFTKIYPFIDGNGRTTRLILNYQLLYNQYLPIIVDNRRRAEYMQCLEHYSVNSDISKFLVFIAELEEIELDRYAKIITDSSK